VPIKGKKMAMKNHHMSDLLENVVNIVDVHHLENC
jgi:hypothetical protein